MRNMDYDPTKQPRYFTEDAFRWNAEGDVNPAQANMLQRYLGAFTTGFMLTIVLLTVMFAVIGGIVLNTVDASSPDSSSMLPLLMSVLGTIFMLIMIWMVWIYYQARHIRRPIISSVQGVASKRSEEVSSQFGRLGMAYYVTIGKKRLRVQDVGTLDAFEEGRSYTVYYIKNRPLVIVLSFRADDA